MDQEGQLCRHEYEKYWIVAFAYYFHMGASLMSSDTARFNRPIRILKMSTKI